jgi:hypothetical protein
VDLVLIFVGRDAVRSAWVKKELEWALKRERELGRSFVFPVLLDDESWDLLKPTEFRRRKYIKCTDYSEAGVRSTAERLKDELFALSSRLVERDHEKAGRLEGIGSATEEGPKSSVESLVGVLRVYQNMSEKRIRDTLSELFDELERSDIPSGPPGIDYVSRVLQEHIHKLEAEHEETSSRADKMRQDLTNEIDDDKKNFVSTIGLVVEGASMAAKLTANHLLTLQKRLEREFRKHPSGGALPLLRSAANQLDTESKSNSSAQTV